MTTHSTSDGRCGAVLNEADDVLDLRVPPVDACEADVHPGTGTDGLPDGCAPSQDDVVDLSAPPTDGCEAEVPLGAETCVLPDVGSPPRLAAVGSEGDGMALDGGVAVWAAAAAIGDVGGTRLADFRARRQELKRERDRLYTEIRKEEKNELVISNVLAG